MASQMDWEDVLESGRLDYLGPAQNHFDTLSVQARDFLKWYLPNWNHYRDPKNYLLPIIFHYTNAECSDEACDAVRGTTSDAILVKREGDEAEHMVYKAISQMVKEKIGAPFVAFRGLDTQKFFNKIRSLLKKTERWHGSFFDTKLREHDFILIGPKIGFISIEVKGQPFDSGGRSMEADQPGSSRAPQLKLDIPMVVDWDNVSSMEWPIVIFVSCLPELGNFEPTYKKYRAYSRATGMLFDISFEFEDDTRKRKWKYA